MRKKKSYNPFKMWGSYVGAVILVIITYLIYNPQGLCVGAVDFFLTTSSCLNPNTLTGLLIIFGFLIGWGIHSLFRRLRK